MPKTDITITDEQVQGFIAEQIESGAFDKPDEVVTDAMRRFAMYRQRKAVWDEMIAEGLADAKAGRMVDGEVFLQERIQRLKAQL